jgi:hypothetical protein
MEKSEQRFIVKFFFLKGLGSTIIHSKLAAVFGSIIYSLTQVTEWRARFKADDLSCEDKSRPSHLAHVLGKALSDFLEDFLFTTTGVFAKYFN